MKTVKTPIERWWPMVAVTFILVEVLAQHPWRTDQIHWHKNLAHALQIAQAHNTPLLIDFSSDACAPCRQMDQDVFADISIENKIQSHFVPVRLDGFRDQANLAKFHVFAIPTVIVLSPNGKEIDRSEGYVAPHSFSLMLKSNLSPGNA